MQHVSVTTGARLHFGLLSVNPERRRIFGGIGLMIDEPGICISAEAAEHDAFIAESNELRGRLEQFVRQCRDRGFGTEPVRLTAIGQLPSHAGFGSGTQIGLAVAAALQAIAGENRSVTSLANDIGRGQRSAIGIHGFQSGGFLVDGGRTRNSREIGRLAARVNWPDDWRVVLISPDEGMGLHGAAERTAFQSMSVMPESLTQFLCMTTLMEILPALRNGDFPNFCRGLDAFGNAVGDFFAESQGGRFASPSITALVEGLRAAEFHGLAQSSWGPTLCAFARNDSHAAAITEFVANHDLKFTTQIVRGRNSGAQIHVHDEATAV